MLWFGYNDILMALHNFQILKVVTKRAYARILEGRPRCTLEMEKVTQLTSKLDNTLHACR